MEVRARVGKTNNRTTDKDIHDNKKQRGYSGDIHLGSQLGKDWLKARIAQIEAQQPDIVVLLGDIFEGHGLPENQLIEPFKLLSAPYGIWSGKNTRFWKAVMR